MSRKRDEIDDIEREFEGYEVLQKLLADSGAMAEADDVVEAFKLAIEENVAAPEVIEDLWLDQPRFAKPKDAARLFGNLLALFDLVKAGETPPETVRTERVKRVKQQKPELPADAIPTRAFLDAASRWFVDYPKERERFHHAFDNRQDALVSWLDDSGLGDQGFGLARHLLGEAFAMLELAGKKVASLDESMIPEKAKLESLPGELSAWLEEALVDESTREDEPMEENEALKVRDLVTRAVSAMWETAK
ncbi:MAG: hypothetical protein DI536_34000 [Archangium gephyra]|uniref:Uncharacterized protein n=1 Tax=Archangium gephyra TaxID=48 RepID=A0A2W5SN95_9BACT|nr:MAG: hypothetical protein DI536_34000 [Archangium gephyra]